MAALTEHAQPPPGGLIPLTRNEIARLAAILIIQPAASTASGCTGPHGAGTTSTPPATVTTSAKPPMTRNALLLPY